MCAVTYTYAHRHCNGFNLIIFYTYALTMQYIILDSSANANWL